MSTDAVLTEPRQASLPDLAATAAREHDLAIRAGESMLLHAVQAGEALIDAKAQVEPGEWVRWLKANFPASDRTAKQYMRIARGREQVLASGVKTLSEAERQVPALPRGFYRERPLLAVEEEEAREMHRGGGELPGDSRPLRDRPPHRAVLGNSRLPRAAQRPTSRRPPARPRGRASQADQSSPTKSRRRNG